MKTKILLSFIFAIILIGLASATITTTLNSPTDASTQYTRLVTTNATGTVTGGEYLANITLYDNSTGSWGVRNITLLGDTNTIGTPSNPDGFSNPNNAFDGNLSNYADYTNSALSGTTATKSLGTTFAANTVGIVTIKSDFFIAYTLGGSDTITWDMKLQSYNGATWTNEATLATNTGSVGGGGATISYDNNYTLNKNVQGLRVQFNIASSSGPSHSVIMKLYELKGTITQTTLSPANINIYSIGSLVKWNYLTCASGGSCQFATSNYTFSIDSQAPTIFINAGNGTQNYGILTTNHTINFTATDTNLDKCWYSYNGTNSTIQACSTGVLVSKNFTMQSGLYSAIVYANDTVGNLNSNSFSWSYNIFSNSITYSNTTTSLANENYIYNFTYDTSTFSSLSGAIVYNGTYVSVPISSAGGNYILNYSKIISAVTTQTNYSFYFSLNLNYVNGSSIVINSSTYQQTVNPILIDDCSSYTNKILNLTMFDEDTNAYLNISNSSIRNGTIQIQVRLSNLVDSTNYQVYSVTKSNTNPASICVSNGVLASSYRLDATIQYVATGYITRFNYIQNYPISNLTAPLNRTLYNLLTTESQEFKITYKDATFLPVANAVIEIQKNFVGAGYYAPVEYGLTDSYGQTVGHFVLGTNSYAINVYVDGQLVSSYPNIQPLCSNIATGDCQINLNALTSPYQFINWNNINNLNYTYNFSESLRTLGLTWALSNVSYGNSNITLIVNLADALTTSSRICYISQTASSGIYNCNINSSFGNTTIEADLYKDGKFIQATYFTITNGAQTTLGNTGIMFGFIILVCVVLMFSNNPTMTIVGGILGLMAIAAFALINFNNSNSGNSIALISGTIISAIVVALILIWQINKSNQGTA